MGNNLASTPQCDKNVGARCGYFFAHTHRTTTKQKQHTTHTEHTTPFFSLAFSLSQKNNINNHVAYCAQQFWETIRFGSSRKR